MNAPDEHARHIALAHARIARAQRVVVLTGAGVSAESGLRTFRGATTDDLPPDMRALWREFDPATLATPFAFEADPGRVTRWYDWRRLGCLAAQPNPAHTALAAFERELLGRGGSFALLTQNVDGLHQRAGSVNVIELHGTILTWRCTLSMRRVTPPAEPFPTFPPPSPFHKDALLRPDVVWFGEPLSEAALEGAHEAASQCDLLISVGTSAQVYPAAGFIDVAASHGAYTIEVNAEPTPASSRVNVSIRGRAGEVLPVLIGAAG